jgi:hypothetical protein
MRLDDICQLEGKRNGIRKPGQIIHLLEARKISPSPTAEIE